MTGPRRGVLADPVRSRAWSDGRGWHEPDHLAVVCPACRAVEPLPRHSLGGTTVCGACGTPFLAPEPPQPPAPAGWWRRFLGRFGIRR